MFQSIEHLNSFESVVGHYVGKVIYKLHKFFLYNFVHNFLFHVKRHWTWEPLSIKDVVILLHWTGIKVHCLHIGFNIFFILKYFVYVYMFVFIKKIITNRYICHLLSQKINRCDFICNPIHSLEMFIWITMASWNNRG